MSSELAGLYIHVPFCLSKCRYCSFFSIQSVDVIPEFAASLQQEIKYYTDEFSEFDTIYIGGGTPSLLSISMLEEIINAIYKNFRIGRVAEVSMEVNPGDISVNYFQLLLKLGINRLNIGIQSFDDSILKFLGRRHNSEDAIKAIKYARAAGFTNIGIDLIYCVYGQKISSWMDTLRKGVSFSPEHISCYQLTLEKKNFLYRHYVLNKIPFPTEDEELDFFLTTSNALNDAGYIHYEVSNFSRAENLKSRHNMKYWNHASYLGLGPSAHSFSGNKRWWNKSNVKTYIEDLSCGKIPLECTEILSAQKLQMETLFLGMRTKAGVDLRSYKSRYGRDLLEDKKEFIAALVKNKLVEINKGFLIPTLRGMAVADSLALI